MATDAPDLLKYFIELMRDECGATVSLEPDSAEFAAVLEARAAYRKTDKP